MPTYPYECTSCSHQHDVIKSVRQIDDPEACPKCQAPSKRYLVAVNFNGAGDWDTTRYNPGLGCVVKSNRDAEKIAARRGLIAVGNEDVSKFMTSQEKKLEADLEARTEKALEPVVDRLANKILHGEKI